MLGIDPRVARAAWTVVLIAAILCMAYLARETLFILVLAVFLAYLVIPGVHLLQRHAPRISRGIAVAIVFLLVVGVIAGGAVSLGSAISEQATALSERLPALLEDPGVADRIPLPHWLEPLRAKIVETVREQVQGGGNHTASFAQRIGVGILGFAGNLVYVVVIPILAFMLLKDGPRMHDALIGMIPAGPRRTFWKSLLQDLNTLLARYVRALLMLSIATFCAYAIVFSLLGVPYALVLAAIAGPLEFIPVLGPLTGAGIALLVAAFSGYDHLVWIVVFVGLYRLFQDYVLSPYLMSEGIELHPVLVIAGVLGGEQIGGVPGMFLAIPLLAAAKIIFEKTRPAPTQPVS